MTQEQIDEIVCAWSMEFGVALTEEALNALVTRLALESSPVLQ